MEQFLMIDTEVANNGDLSSNDKLIYTSLCDRMKSSVKRTQFYDKKARAYFVIYTINEMCKFWHLSKNTVVKSYKKLVEMGYLIKQPVYNGSSKLFLPTFKVENVVITKPAEETEVETTENVVTTKPVEETEVETTENVVTTKPVEETEVETTENVVTTKPVEETEVETTENVVTTKPAEETEVETTDNVVIAKNDTPKSQKLGYNHNNLNHNKHIDTNNTKKLEKIKFDNLKKNLVKQGGFDEHSANLLALYSFGNPDDLYSVAGTIYKAKKTIANKYPEYAYDLLLEHNNNLANTVKNISIHAGKAKNRMGYIFKSYLAYFEDIVLQSKAQNSTEDVPDIPIFKLV